MAVLVAISDNKVFAVDRNGTPKCLWLEVGVQQGSLSWLKNCDGFLTTQGGTVTARIFKGLQELNKSSILSVPPGPLLARVTGDGRTLFVVQHNVVPGSICSCYDLEALLSAAPKPPMVVEDHNHSVLALAASTVTTHIAMSTSSGIVRLFDAGSGAPFKSWELPGGHTPKGCLAFSQKNALEPLRLAAGADDGQVFVWDLSPVASGPVVVGMQQLRGRRVTGVGFGAYKKESVLVASSDLGQICVMNMQNYTSLQSNDVLSMDLKVGISSLAIRDDGQLLAVGTRDGRVGVIGFEALIHKKSPQAFRVVDLGTGLSVTDVAFRSSRHTKDQSGENNANAAAAAPVPVGTALGPSAAQRIPLEDTTNSSGAKRRLLLDKQDANAARVATARPVAAAASQLQQPVAAATNIPLGATGNVASMRPTASSQLATPGGPASVAAPAGSGGAAASGPAGQPSVPRPLGSAQPQAAQRPAMPPLAIPGITQPIGQHKRQSDAGDGDNTGSSSTSPTGPQSMAEVAIGAGGQVLTSPVAQTAVAVPPSLSRWPCIPRAGASGGGHPPARPRGSNDSALTSSTAGLRSYLDDFRLEVRELVRGLAVDMVRHAIQAERAHQNGITLLRLENRVLQDEIESMRQGLAENLRFGLLGRQGAPWQ